MGVLCQACDGRLHEVSPFHDRKAWRGSHFESIPPTITVDHMMQTKTIGIVLCITSFVLYVFIIQHAQVLCLI